MLGIYTQQVAVELNNFAPPSGANYGGRFRRPVPVRDPIKNTKPFFYLLIQKIPNGDG
jgi:hypothetical protein